MRFEWDGAKAALNLMKHGVSFLEATAVFADSDTLDWEDTAHSSDELRRIALGHTERGLLAIAYTVRGNNLRIISARLASGRERRNYGASQREKD
jgi:uncharacterized protein